MLGSRQRLRSRDDFTATLRRGRRAGRGALVVYLLAPASSPDSVPSGRPASARAGFVVPRTVGTAVERNRVRRRLQHLIRPHLDRLPPGSDLVVRALPGAAGYPHDRLKADLDAAIAAASSRRPRPEGRRRSTEVSPAKPDASDRSAGETGLRQVAAVATRLAVRVLLAPIAAYRRWISPALPPRCRFYPTCSEYAVTAITTWGPVRGLYLAIRRILRCHPWHPGGFDPVPPAPPRTRRESPRGSFSRSIPPDLTGAVTEWVG